ncbi:30S ribosome-binding factor RbfA [Patescibacteria group bacterium]
MAQISELIQQQLSELIIRELELPQDCLITITKVKTSRDLSYADVLVSVLPYHKTEEMIKYLSKKRHVLQSILAKKITIASFPTLRFHSDDTEDQASHIEALIDSLE